MNSESNQALLDIGTESDLLGSRLKAGDRDAQLVVWNYGIRHLIPWYISLKFSRAEAEDLWSATFLKQLATNFKTFDPELGAVTPWLKAVAKRAAFYKIRERRRRREVALEDCRDQANPEDTLGEMEGGQLGARRRVKRLLGPLSDTDRSCIFERFYEDLSFDLIAERHGISEVAARMRVSRALTRIRARVERLNSRELSRRTRQNRRANTRRAAPPAIL
jgi:RNA polymerase sigma factor (sigma-70 family)